MRKTAKDVRTDYGIRKGRRWFIEGVLDKKWGSFKVARLYAERSGAAWVNEKNELHGEVVPVRCRALSSKTRASKHRTK
jgi:hypothetical protein